ncbi:MAG TPA: hypothetical protein VGC50_03480 [Gammaproteobacteria bacterium]
MQTRSGITMIGALALIFPIMTAAQTIGGAVPDFSGVWQRSSSGDTFIEGEPPMTAWGRERFDLAKPIHGPRTASATESNAAELTCMPMGIPASYLRPRPFEILQLPDRAVMLFEVSNFWRMIYMDGREFPEVPLHTWNGYSIGHYEGDSLVVETRHAIGWVSEDVQRWLDRLGHPFSDELTVVERIRHIDENTLENRITIDDPVAYERPLTGVMTYRKRDFELAEFICQELMLSELPEMRPGQN